ncbi:MAG: DUF542 domain-containing protein [Thermoleophilia bacterium]|nr:DUF542 domain-containing protein [Thermoleophilia bacterium]
MRDLPLKGVEDMDITSATKVGDIATMVPAAIEVFERYGVDFCCNGKRPLDEALRGTGLSVGDILAEIERATEAQAQEDELHQDWSGYAPGTLADHIEATHHGYLRAELPKIGARMATVLSVHGERHPELFELGRLFREAPPGARRASGQGGAGRVPHAPHIGHGVRELRTGLDPRVDP